MFLRELNFRHSYKEIFLSRINSAKRLEKLSKSIAWKNPWCLVKRREKLSKSIAWKLTQKIQESYEWKKREITFSILLFTTLIWWKNYKKSFILYLLCQTKDAAFSHKTSKKSVCPPFTHNNNPPICLFVRPQRNIRSPLTNDDFYGKKFRDIKKKNFSDHFF